MINRVIPVESNEAKQRVGKGLKKNTKFEDGQIKRKHQRLIEEEMRVTHVLNRRLISESNKMKLQNCII